MLVSAVQQFEISYRYIPISLSLPPPIPTPRSSQSTKLSSCTIQRLCTSYFTGGRDYMSVLPFVYPTLSIPHESLHWYFCPANGFINTIFLGSIYIYVLIYNICFSLSVLWLCITSSRLPYITHKKLLEVFEIQLQIIVIIWFLLLDCLCESLIIWGDNNGIFFYALPSGDIRKTLMSWSFILFFCFVFL